MSNEQQKDNGGMIIIVLVAAVFLMNNKGCEKPSPSPTPDNPQSVQPDAATVAKLGPIRQIAATNPAAARKVSGFYLAATRIAERPEVTTAQQLLDALSNAEKIKAGLNPELLLPGFGAVRNSFVQGEIGNQAIALDGESRKKLCDTFKAIAWGLQNP